VPEHKIHAEKNSEMASLEQVFIIYNDGPQDYIHLQKNLGHIHNYHTLLTQANSSYQCYELKIEDRQRLRNSQDP
jgi:hypothetical protein